MREALALLLAFVAASLYALSTSLQALEARQTDPATALSASLLGRLARRRLWLLGAAAGIAAWPMQLGALAIGAVALVQPALGFGLVVLLVLGVVVLHERVGPRELAGVAGIALALGVLAWAAPSETGAYTAGGTWLIGAAIVVLAPLPPLLRRANHVGGLPTSIASGVGWTVVALATSLVY